MFFVFVRMRKADGIEDGTTKKNKKTKRKKKEENPATALSSTARRQHLHPQAKPELRARVAFHKRIPKRVVCVPKIVMNVYTHAKDTTWL